MKIEKCLCDYCKDYEVEDIHEKAGWVRVSGDGFNISVSLGKEDNGDIKMAFFSKKPLEDLDFCSIDCFRGWLIQLQAEEEKKLREKA
jgi:hypothetical protein